MQLRNIALTLLIAGQLIALSAAAQDAIETRYGYVVDKREIKGDSNVTTGAIIGGIAGLVTASGKSGSTKLKRTAGGALIGGVIANQVDKSKRHWRYTVAFPGGDEVDLELQDDRLALRDCAAVRYDVRQTSVNYASDYFCEREEIGAETAQQPSPSDTCQEAKQRLLDAEGESEVALLIEKVKVICDQQ